MNRPKGETLQSIKGETAHEINGNIQVHCRFENGLMNGGEGGVCYGEGVGLCGHVCVCKYVAPWEHPATSHHPPRRRIRPSAHLSHQSHLEDTHTLRSNMERLCRQCLICLSFCRLATLQAFCRTVLNTRPKSPPADPTHASYRTQVDQPYFFTQPAWGVGVHWIHSNTNGSTHVSFKK